MRDGNAGEVYGIILRKKSGIYWISGFGPVGSQGGMGNTMMIDDDEPRVGSGTTRQIWRDRREMGRETEMCGEGRWVGMTGDE